MKRSIDRSVEIAVSLLVLGGIIVFIAILGTCIGAFVGLIVGAFFPDTFYDVQKAFGMNPVPTWQLGAFFGFIGAFFRGGGAQLKTENNK